MTSADPSTNPAAGSQARGIDVRDHFARNGLDWGVGDLLVAGGSIELLGDLLACLLNVRDQDGKRPVKRIVVFHPPGLGSDAEIVRAVSSAIGRWRGSAPTIDEEEILARFIKTASTATFEVESLLALIRDAAPGSATVIRYASSYRDPEIGGAEKVSRFSLSEDFWAPHLHALCTKVLETVRGRELYLAIEAENEWPFKAANRELLSSVEGLGVLGGGVQDAPGEFLAGRMEAWADAVATGVLGPVLREIDALPSGFDDFKQLWRLQLLRNAKLDGLARECLKTIPPRMARERIGEGIIIAGIADGLGERHVAEQFLREVAPEKLTLEFLESMLVLSAKLGLPDLEPLVEKLLEERHPHSAALSSVRIGRAVAIPDFRVAADLSDKLGTALWNARAKLYRRLADIEGRTDIDFDAVFADVGLLVAAGPGLAAKTLAEQALRSKQPDAALRIVLSEEKIAPIDGEAARICLQALSECLVAGQTGDAGPVTTEMLTSAASAVLGAVARTPGDGGLRNMLVRTLSTESMGLHGLALLLSITLDLARRQQRPQPLQDFKSWTPPASPETTFEFLKPVMAWMAQSSPLMIGRIKLPERFVNQDADALIMGLVHFLEKFDAVQTDAGSETFTQLLGCAMAVAPYGRIKDMDISMLRLGAIRMALAGRQQKARDLAETALTLAGDDPQRIRVAWHCHGDVYARTNDLHEALVATACGLIACDVATPDQVFYESMLLFRIARDLRMTELAQGFLDAGRDALSGFGALDTYQTQLDTSALQLRFLKAAKFEETPDPVDLPGLIDDLVANANDVLAVGLDVGPVAIILGQVLREAGLAGVDVAEDAPILLAELSERCHPSVRAMLTAASQRAPTAEDVLSIAKSIDVAQHSQDFAFDIRRLTVLARRQLSGEAAKADPTVAAFAIELLSDVSIIPPGANAPSLPSSVDLPMAQAARFAREQELSVILIGLDSRDTLIRVDVRPDGSATVARTDATTFSRDKFFEWIKEFPFRYGIDDSSFNLFHLSTENIGIGNFPERAVVIASASLQRVPINIFRIGDTFAGDDSRIFAAPSMAWLASARSSETSDGRAVAWISTETSEEGSQTLQTIADRLRDTLDTHQVLLSEATAVPTEMVGADLAIIAAHGGLLPGGFYFHVIANDAEFKAAAGRLADAVRGVGVAVLFVCSGGRVDSHPMANTTIGLVKYALEAGCRTVVASPWPLDSRVPSYWLPAFLDAWKQGTTVVDATYAANQAVKTRFSAEQRDYLAMHVYGDGLRVRRA